MFKFNYSTTTNEDPFYKEKDPKDGCRFKATVKELDEATEESWKDRLLDEYEQITDRLIDLLIFIDSDQFDDLDTEDKSLLKSQAKAMDEYIKILERRVHKLTEEKKPVKKDPEIDRERFMEETVQALVDFLNGLKLVDND